MKIWALSRINLFSPNAAQKGIDETKTNSVPPTNKPNYEKKTVFFTCFGFGFDNDNNVMGTKHNKK